LVGKGNGNRDEDRNPRRGGSLERDQPISLLRRPWSAGVRLLWYANEKAQEGRHGIGRVVAGRERPLEG
jgi:hypothetical protein